MSNSITLTASMRSNLSSLKSLANQMSTTQTRLSTGKKVNSAIDNASSYYQARSLNNRAADLDALLDSMGQGIQTIAAANEGVEAGLKMIEQMQSVAQSAITAAGNQPTTIEPLTYGPLHNGKAYTQAIVDQLGEAGLAAYAATQFYAPGVAADDENFGQEQWYLPAIGELMDMYGYDAEGYVQHTQDVPSFLSGEWVTGENIVLVNESLGILADKGVQAAVINGEFWSSSEILDNSAAFLEADGKCNATYKYFSMTFLTIKPCNVRLSSVLENQFIQNDVKPQIGDVMYSDLSYGNAEDYDGNKTAVGIVYWVSDDGNSAKITNLKNLTFSSSKSVGNFDASNPYNNIQSTTWWCTSNKQNENIAAIPNIAIDSQTLNLDIIEWNSGTGGMVSADLSAYNEQFNALYEQYDKLIQDASYQGINLLNGGDLNVIFNESRSHSYTVEGQHADAASLGLTKADWQSAADIETAINQLQDATSSLRRISEELGNSYAVITNREKFTDALIDVLQTGADNLVLADMNEESANYLALQTRQQLAINALSLAAQSGSAVLKLF